MSTFLRLLLAIVGLPVFFVVGLLVAAPLVVKKGIFAPWPYIRTAFAPDFTARNFELIRIGMSRQEVERLLGKPLLYDSTNDSPPSCAGVMARYSIKKNIYFNLVDWRGFEIFYGPDCKVVGKRSSWWDESTS